MLTKNKFLYGFGWFLIGCLMIGLLGLAVMLLWNWLIPEIFNGPTLSYVQSLGILLLTKLLTGFSGWRNHSHHSHGYKPQWKKRWEDKMCNMTNEDKERFKQMYYDRCGRGKHWMEKDKDEQQNNS